MKAVLLNNRYRIIKTLGRGGFGETYLTEDTHMPSGRKCVLKQLKPIVRQPKTPLWMKERFQREAAILEELGQGSEQIPRLYAYFSEDDKFYLVQEWIEGLTLDQHWGKEGNLHRDEVRAILLGLLPVLDYVHSRKIIHRDIKPENIILHHQENQPFLIDFGAVNEAMATENNQDSSSTYSASIGTPGYMSSEQAAGRPIYSSDLYSLGLTAIFLLTGKAPHELETDPRDGEIIWREHAFNLDDDLAAVIDRAIRFHPRDRFSTAQEMLDALQGDLDISNVANPTGVTMNLAPGRNSAGKLASQEKSSKTVALVAKQKQSKSKKSSWLKTAALFVLITTGVAAGTFATGFIIISSWLKSPQPNPEEVVQQPTRKPDIFTKKQDDQKDIEAQETAQKSKNRDELQKDKLKKIAQATKEAAENSEPEVVKSPAANDNDKQPKILTKVEVEPDSEFDLPIVTTGTSESQLVSTLGLPNSERKGWRPNSKVLVYYDVVPDQVNLSYQSDDTGKIRQADVYLDQSVSLGTMQQTLAKMLGGNASVEVKDKLRSVYNRQAQFSFFKTSNLEGKVQRDNKDRVTISVWERGFQ